MSEERSSFHASDQSCQHSATSIDNQRGNAWLTHGHTRRHYQTHTHTHAHAHTHTHTHTHSTPSRSDARTYLDVRLITIVIWHNTDHYNHSCVLCMSVSGLHYRVMTSISLKRLLALMFPVQVYVADRSWQLAGILAMSIYTAILTTWQFVTSSRDKYRCGMHHVRPMHGLNCSARPGPSRPVLLTLHQLHFHYHFPTIFPVPLRVGGWVDLSTSDGWFFIADRLQYVAVGSDRSGLYSLIKHYTGFHYWPAVVCTIIWPVIVHTRWLHYHQSLYTAWTRPDPTH